MTAWSAVEPGETLVPGRRIDDFEILGLLGKGSLARVYLALQSSLGRLVALKVSAIRSDEARALACLEHENIVRVFAEIPDHERGLRLLCMQYVPGMTLERLIRTLWDRERPPWHGRSILEEIDALGPHPGAIDPAALRDRMVLEQSDRFEAVCWIGARLAEALAHAHARGILHRDLKPANILINPYGRPLLADFNLASDRLGPEDASVFGGSLAFMAPEHLEAFNPEDPTPTLAVDERSDLYSLGVVLFELLTGALPFPSVEDASTPVEKLRAMTAARRRGAPSPRSIAPDVPPALDRALRRSLAPDPGRRYASAEELAGALEGCRLILEIEARLPSGPITRAALRRPAAAFALAAFLPHLVGSAINISYNALQIVGDLTVGQQLRFGQIVMAYNAVAYPACAAIAYRMAAPVFRAWRAIERSGPIDDEVVASARRTSLTWSTRAAALACLGWLPGGVIFPMALARESDATSPVGPEVFGHFLASFWISGLIALTYSYFGVEWTAIRVVYPRLWADARGLRPAMAGELGRREARLATFQLLASLIPLSGAALLIGLGPEDLSRTFRTLAGGLIALGMAGVGLSHAVARRLSMTLSALVGPGGRSQARPR